MGIVKYLKPKCTRVFMPLRRVRRSFFNDAIRSVVLLLISIVLASCYPDNFFFEKDIFTVVNETNEKVCVEIQARYPLPGPGCDYIVINSAYADLCRTFEVYNDAHIGSASAISMNLSPGRYDGIVTIQNERHTHQPAQSQHHHSYDDILIYNYPDTTSYLLEGAPYHSEWMSCVWMFDVDAVNQIELRITDSLLSLLKKDYSMLEKFSDYYQ